MNSLFLLFFFMKGNLSLCEDQRQLDQWGLPHPVLEAYRNQGVTTMFAWQAECLLTDNVLGTGTIIYLLILFSSALYIFSVISLHKVQFT